MFFSTRLANFNSLLKAFRRTFAQRSDSFRQIAMLRLPTHEAIAPHHTPALAMPRRVLSNQVSRGISIVCGDTTPKRIDAVKPIDVSQKKKSR